MMRSRPNGSVQAVTQIAVSAVGRDRPGIVAAVTGVLVAHGANLADSQMGILSGRFTMTLIVDAPAELNLDLLVADLERIGEDLGLDAIFAREVGDADEEASLPTRMVTVYGVDHPGIVHAVTRELATRGVNITDLNTRRIEDEDGEPLYAMMLEVAPPDGTDDADLEAALRRVAGEQRVEVTVRELEDDAL
jgi:glycine cleavage system transcriptional repressor